MCTRQKIILAKIILLFIRKLNKEKGKYIHNIFTVYQVIFQKNHFIHPKSRLLKFNFYMASIIILIFFNNHFKTEIVINDSSKPIDELKDILRSEYSHLRPFWLNWER